jgi:UDP-N-acetylglucosamine 1-carboxyvinyltransferase
MTLDVVWEIEPQGPLSGDVRVAGSKNAVSKHMIAALLGEGPSRISNAPHIREVEITAGMLTSLGLGVAIEDGSVCIEPARSISSRVPLSYSGLNRMSILMIGPMLHRTGEVFVPIVGGDRIGPRPVDFHVDALRALGAEVYLSDEGLEAKAHRLHGARIRLPFASVGATETVLLTACMAEGRTVLENCALEPEVVELALFLQRMGAHIELKPDRRFVIEGVDRLRGADHRLGGDRIEAVSYLIAGLATGGRVRVFGCTQERIATAITTLQRMGATFEIHDEWIACEADGLGSAAVHTSPHPGFMTDWHPPIVVLFTQGSGLSVMHETVHEDRLIYAEGLRRMGAEIEAFDQCLGGEPCRFHESRWYHSAVIRGGCKLHAADIEMPDVRAGFAYVTAAAAAHGTSRLRGVHQLERGYDTPLDKFRALGLRIDRRDVPGDG